MKSVFIVPILLLILSSCTANDGDARKNMKPNRSSIVQISSGSVSLETQEILLAAYSEEVLAEDIYTKIVEKYPTLSSINAIIGAEEKHSIQVGRLLDTRNIPRPTGYGPYTETYDTLLQMIDSSLTGAIEVGVMVEVGDIDHLLAEYKKIEDRDVRRVFENIGGGSFNHLRAFLRLASENTYSVTTDFARYMNMDEVNASGSLKYKMTDLLKTNDLPTYASSSPMGKGQGNRESGTGENNQMMPGNGEGQGGARGRGMNR